MNTEIKNKFNNLSKNYDVQRKKIIPCFDDFYHIPLKFIEIKSKSPSILDIGAGTGLFSSIFLQKYPDAQITLIDIAENMLEVAKNRFESNQKIKYITDNYVNYEFDEMYDIIISGLSIHHLEDAEKENLYKKCYKILKPDGIFINADQVLGNNLYVEELNKKIWKQFIKESGLEADQVNATFERLKLDKEAPLEQQLNWLKESGFKDVDCIYKYLHFAVMIGRK